MFSDEEEIEPQENQEPEEDVDEEDEQRIEDGELCANCGAEFEKEQGEPSFCHDCWRVASEEDRRGYIEANCETL